MTTLGANIRSSWRMASNWVGAILTGALLYWVGLPIEQQAAILAEYPRLKHFVPLIGFLGWYVARIVPQKSVSGDA